MDLDSLIQERIDGDAEFQTSLAAMSDEDKATALGTKKSEILKSEFESLTDKATKNEELAKNQKIRAEKAEGALKDKAPEVIKPKDSELSPKDIFALSRANVHEDDIDEVLDYAQFKKISVQEALKLDVIKNSLASNVEKRKTAEAANVKPSRPSNKQVTDDEVLGKLSKGEVPEPGTSDAEKLFWARRGGKK